VIAGAVRNVTPQQAAIAVGVVAAAYVLWKLARAGGAVVDGIKAGAIDPTSSSNLAYRGTNAVGAAVTGNDSFSLGSWLYEKFNPGAVAAERAAVSGPAGPAVLPQAPTMGPAWAGQLGGYQYPPVTGF